MNAKGICLAVLVPLFVTVVGGLLVEYLKPEQAYVPKDTQPSFGQKTQALSASVAPQIRKLLVQKWHIAEKPTLYGDSSVEFTDAGQVVRTYFRKFIPDEVTIHPYEIADDGQLKSTRALNLKLVKVTKDELVLSWDGSVAHYKRGWYWWEITLSGIGIVLLLIICLFGKAVMNS